MNCCDDNGRCTGGAGCAVRAKSAPSSGCISLAICQGKTPPCPGCHWPKTAHDFDRLDRVDGGALSTGETRFGQQPLSLAPGMVEGYKVPVFGSAAQRRELRRWLIGALAWGAVSVVAGLGVGLLVGLFSGVVR